MGRQAAWGNRQFDVTWRAFLHPVRAVRRRLNTATVSFLPAGPTSAAARARIGLVRTRSEAELRVIFSRDGQNTRLVPNPERAAVTAVLMIAGRGSLHAGDQLLVQHYDKAD
jgi:hypothetical protein